MKKEVEYLSDLEEIKSLMLRSAKFISLSGWAGIVAGFLGITGALIVYYYLDFNPSSVFIAENGNEAYQKLWMSLISLALIIFTLAILSALYFTNKNASKKSESAWTPAAKRMVISMAIPLFTGGILILILISKGLIGLIIPVTLIFYGLALFAASAFTYQEVKILGLVEITFGLLSTYFISLSLLFWGLGFGLTHIIYGIYVYFKYEK